MPILKRYINLNKLDFARWLLILLLIALLFSPPLVNLFELTLFAMFIFIDELRKRMVLALKQPLVIATLCFYLLLLLDTTYSLVSWKESLSSFWGWRKILLLPISVALFDEKIWKQKLAFVFIMVTTMCAVLSFLSKFLGFTIHTYPVGIIIRNHATQGIIFSVAAFTVATLLISIPAIFSRLQKWGLCICIFILTVNVIYITPGRSGYLALIVLGLIFAVAYAYLNKKIVVPLIILGLIPIVLLSSPTVRQRISQGVNEAELYKSRAEATSMGIRMVLWNNTIELIRERPLLGVGTGAFQQAYKTEVVNEPSWKQDITHDPHNQFLKIATEQGIVGLIVFIGMILSAFWQKPSFTYYILGIGILFAWCGNSLFSSHFSTFSEGRFIFLWCGVMLAKEVVTKPKHL